MLELPQDLDDMDRGLSKSEKNAIIAYGKAKKKTMKKTELLEAVAVAADRFLCTAKQFSVWRDKYEEVLDQAMQELLDWQKDNEETKR